MTDTAMGDPTAEAVVLGITIRYPEESRETWDQLPPDVWWREDHRTIATAVTQLYRRDLLHFGDLDEVDRVRAAVEKVQQAASAAHGGTDQRLPALMNLVGRLALEAPPPIMLTRYVDRIRYLHQMRTAREAAVAFLQRLDSLAYDDTETGLAEAAAMMRGDLELVERQAVTEVPAPMPLRELLARPKEYHWLVPGLLEVGDRLTVTGPEGVGKSELFHQLATAIAAQLHPFAGWPLPPKDDGTPYRAMVVDAENSQPQLFRRLRRQARIMDDIRRQNDMPPLDWTSLTHRIVLRPDGMELTSPEDVARLSLAIEQAQPDVVAIGPLYKLTDQDLNDAQAVKSVQTALDRLRVRHGCVLLIEHHPGHERSAKGVRSVRPAGSSLLQRWGEFGIGIRPQQGGDNRAVDVVRWRGDREARSMPETLVRGGPGQLPWMPGEDSYLADVDQFMAPQPAD